MLKIKFFALVFLSLVCIFDDLFALPLVPDIYIGGAIYSGENKIKDVYNNNSSIGTRDGTFKNKSYLLSIGIRPIDLPILGNFRFEGSYSGSISGDNAASKYGLVMYFDLFRFIPIINPYIGLGYSNTSYDFKDSYKNLKNNVGEYSMHGGLNISPPFIPFDVYLEYKYFVAGDSFAVNKLNSYKVEGSNIMLGARFYFLK